MILPQDTKNNNIDSKNDEKNIHSSDGLRNGSYQLFAHQITWVTLVHAWTCSTRPWRFLYLKIPPPCIYLQSKSLGWCVFVWVLASETWKQAAIVRKRAVRISRKDRKMCPGCLRDLKGGCDHAVSLDQSQLPASIPLSAAAARGGKKTQLFSKSTADITVVLHLPALVHMYDLLCTC